MQSQPIKPGVYIEESAAGSRTIAGVSTSMTAFIGRTYRGQANEPTLINSFIDYNRKFGGLWSESTMSFAVRDFFLNGGSQAIVVRLINGASHSEIELSASADEKKLIIVSSNEGSWGNKLSLVIDHNIQKMKGRKRDPDLFNLTISEENGISEQFLNVSLDKKNRQYLPTMLEQRSDLIRVKKTGTGYDLPKTRPDAITVLAGTTNPDHPGSDGSDLESLHFIGEPGLKINKQGLWALEKTDLFNLLCIPPYSPVKDIGTDLIAEAIAYCQKRRAIFIVDPPSDWTNKEMAITQFIASRNAYPAVLSNHAAIYFPRIMQTNPLNNDLIEEFAPCGAIAGIIARTDANRGVWKAPAGLDAHLEGVSALSISLTDSDNGTLNQLGINCLRDFPNKGPVVWGARTLEGADQMASEWKYLPVRRTALYIEESMCRGLDWVAFEPNDEDLWAQIRQNATSFMQILFSLGAFQGQSPKDAYFVKCGHETTTQDDIISGIINIIVGFAPLKPAEFVIVQIQQITGNANQ